MESALSTRDTTTPGRTRHERLSLPNSAPRLRGSAIFDSAASPRSSTASTPPQTRADLHTTPHSDAAARSWDPREDAIIRKHMTQLNGRPCPSWPTVTEAVNDLHIGRPRTVDACATRWHKILKPRDRRRRPTSSSALSTNLFSVGLQRDPRKLRGSLAPGWEPEEDAALLEAYFSRNPRPSWEIISVVVNAVGFPDMRTPRACRGRWETSLRHSSTAQQAGAEQEDVKMDDVEDRELSDEIDGEEEVKDEHPTQAQSPHQAQDADEEEEEGPSDMDLEQADIQAERLLNMVADDQDPSQQLTTSVDAKLLEQAGTEFESIRPGTSEWFSFCLVVARHANSAKGHNTGGEFDPQLLADAAKDIEHGQHKCLCVASQYKKLSGKDIKPEPLQKAMKDIESAKSQKNGWFWFCVAVRQADLAARGGGRQQMSEKARGLQLAVDDIEKGKHKWLCVAARYDELVREQ